MVRTRAMRTLENACRRLGFVRVAGVDEVGRGCLAGPVVAGAVVLDPDCHIAGLSDSKQVPAPERDRLYDEIVRCALAWSVASAEHHEIERAEYIRFRRIDDSGSRRRRAAIAEH